MSEEALSEYSDPFENKIGKCRVHATVNLFSKAKQDALLFDEIATGLKTKWAMMPSLFIWSTEDPILGLNSERGSDSFRRNQELLPQAGTHLIADANHFLQEDKPFEISQRIRDFLSAH